MRVVVLVAMGLMLFLLKENVRREIGEVKHVVLVHLSRRRLEWAVTLGVVFVIGFYCFHVAVCEKLAELMCMPAMEAFLSRNIE